MAAIKTTETQGYIEERDSSNVLRKSFKTASKYLGDIQAKYLEDLQPTRRKTITLTIPAEYLDSNNNLVIDKAELKRQCELYVKKRLERRLQIESGMNIEELVKEGSSSSASSSTLVEGVVADESKVKERSARTPRRKNGERRSKSGSKRRSSKRKCNESKEKQETAPAKPKPDPPEQNEIVSSENLRDRCIRSLDEFSSRSIDTYNNVSDRCIEIFRRLSQRQRIYVAVGILLFIIIVNVIAATVRGSESELINTSGPVSDLPTISPTFDMYTGSEEYLQSLLHDFAPLNKNAFNWLKNTDSWEPPRDATNIEQLWIERYVLAAFYFSTITSETTWKNEQNWISDQSICIWLGVTCNGSGEVSDITLSHNEIVGSIPREIGNLTSLKRLKLDSNEFFSGIPREIGNLSNLEHLDLYFNMLSGTLPNEIGMLSSLTGLYLRGNQLSGNLPDSFGGLVSLTELQLSENKFRGNVSRHLGSLTELVTLILDKNRFSGSLPPSLGALTRLKWLKIDENEITGSIPIEIGYLTSLMTVVIGNNMLTGTLPYDLSILTKLNRLDLRWNMIEGTIPAAIKRLSSLHYLNLSTNQLNGVVPDLPLSLKKQEYKNGPFCSLVLFRSTMEKSEGVRSMVNGTEEDELGENGGAIAINKKGVNSAACLLSSHDLNQLAT